MAAAGTAVQGARFYNAFSAMRLTWIAPIAHLLRWRTGPDVSARLQDPSLADMWIVAAKHAKDLTFLRGVSALPAWRYNARLPLLLPHSWAHTCLPFVQGKLHPDTNHTLE